MNSSNVGHEFHNPTPTRIISDNTMPCVFKNTYELLNLRARKLSPVNKIYIFQCMSKIFFVWNSKNSTQNIIPIH